MITDTSTWEQAAEEVRSMIGWIPGSVVAAEYGPAGPAIAIYTTDMSLAQRVPPSHNGFPVLVMPSSGAVAFGATSSPVMDNVVKPAIYLAGFASFLALTYHGYKRNDSVGWALVWGILGGIVWPITVPIAVAQGFAKPKRG